MVGGGVVLIKGKMQHQVIVRMKLAVRPFSLINLGHIKHRERVGVHPHIIQCPTERLVENGILTNHKLIPREDPRGIVHANLIIEHTVHITPDLAGTIPLGENAAASGVEVVRAKLRPRTISQAGAVAENGIDLVVIGPNVDSTINSEGGGGNHIISRGEVPFFAAVRFQRIHLVVI